MIFPQLPLHSLPAEFDFKTSSLPGFYDINFQSVSGTLDFLAGFFFFPACNGQDHLVKQSCGMVYS